MLRKRDIDYSPNTPAVKFYEPRTVHIYDALGKERVRLEKQFEEYKRAIADVTFYSNELKGDVLTMCSVERIIAYKHHIGMLCNAIRRLPPPFCNILEPKLPKPFELD